MLSVSLLLSLYLFKFIFYLLLILVIVTVIIIIASFEKKSSHFLRKIFVLCSKLSLPKLSFHILGIVRKGDFLCPNKTISIAQENKLFDGIDVSSYQGTIDFNRVKASGIDVVYIKAGEGGQITDPYFKQNYLKASRAGLIFGAYYYVTAKNTSEAKAQANDFFNLIRATSFNARPAMDFEDFSGMERKISMRSD